MLNYEKLMSHKPFSYGTFTNLLNQTIEFYEHPIQGQDAEVVCVCHELKLASYSGFYETTDMVQDHREYEPQFIDGIFYTGEYQPH